VTPTWPGSPTSSAWHLPPADLAAYVAGTTRPPATVTVEAHLARCAGCRTALAGLVDPAPLRSVWDSVAEAVSAPAPPLLERLAVRCGLPPLDALLLAASPTLRPAWLLGLLTNVLFLCAAAGDGLAYRSLLFLAVAPLVPVAAVALAHGRELDPFWEISLSTPYSRLRLVLVRALAVVGATLPLALVAADLIPGPWWFTGAWLVPSAACVSVALAASTWFDLTRSTAVVAVGWVALVGLLAGPGLGEPALVLDPPLLVAYAAVCGAGCAVVRRRQDTHLVRRPA
jgi:hypothetical protein